MALVLSRVARFRVLNALTLVAVVALNGAAATGAMSAWVCFGLLTFAAFAGNAVNYSVGRFIGPRGRLGWLGGPPGGTGASGRRVAEGFAYVAEANRLRARSACGGLFGRRA